MPAKDQAPICFSEAPVCSNWGWATIIRVIWSKAFSFSDLPFNHVSKRGIGEILPKLKIGPNLLSSCLDWLSMSIPFPSLSFTCAELLILLLHPVPSPALVTNLRQHISAAYLLKTLSNTLNVLEKNKEQTIPHIHTTSSLYVYR